MSVSDWAGAVSDWRVALGELKGLIAPVSRRSEQRLSVGAFIDGLLSQCRTAFCEPNETGPEIQTAAA